MKCGLEKVANTKILKAKYKIARTLILINYEEGFLIKTKILMSNKMTRR